VLKHFAVNEQETERMRIDTIVSQRTLREIYLRPFEIAIKEASPWAVITAYNKLNGHHCDSSEYLLERVLRNDWGWDGLVMSDWGGTNSSVEALNAGLDLEMPGPTIHRNTADILELIQSGQVSEEVVDRSALSLLKFLKRVGAFENPSPRPETSVDRLEDRKLIREIAGKGAVLLKNDKDILPLSKDKVRGKNVAVIGLAKTWLGHGGGSAAVKPHYSVTAWDALKDALGHVCQLHFAKGAHTGRFLAPLINDENKTTIVGLDGEPGWTRCLYTADADELTETKHGQHSSNVAPFNPETFSKIVEFTCDFTPKETGPHYFAISGVGPTYFYIDGQLVFEQDNCAPDAMGFLFGVQEDGKRVHYLCSGTRYRLRVRTVPPSLVPGLEILQGRPGLRLGMCPGSMMLIYNHWRLKRLRLLTMP
jgi:beta-glucosidase